MKLLINTSNLYVGGSLQIALSFLNEIKKYDNNEYYIFISLAIAKQIDIYSYSSNFIFYTIEKSPASLKSRIQIVKKLTILESSINPDIVFTISGPSYWKPKSKHLLGFADGWVYNPDTIAYSRLSLYRKLKMKLHVEYKKYYLKRDADYYVIETNDARLKLSKTINFDKSKIFVVGNTYSSVFNEKDLLDEKNKYYIKLPKKTNTFRFMYITHNHPSKNLSVINDILEYDENLNIEFVLTIDSVSFKSIFPNDKGRIINIGPIAQKSCPSIYSQCDALFAPTLLETFSAVYPESMKMEIPILTSRLSFATDICEDASLYFNPEDINDIIKCIKSIINNDIIRKELVNNGIKRLKSFESAETRAEKYLEICENIIKKENK
jgi:glycosyltransferase involved in cell wall biosynthesis